MPSINKNSDLMALLDFFQGYSDRLCSLLRTTEWVGVAALAADIRDVWAQGHHVFICGNGGSAGNAIHLANDFIYGIAKRTGAGLRVSSLSANPAVITCLANDVGYEAIFSEQLAVLGSPGDLLVTLSGSGNSPNILKVLEQARSMDIKSYAILGYDGGKCKSLADVPIHFPVHDMQISEDMQIIVGHMLMQWLFKNPPAK
jgi:D-sedoheptulose 7-phosphate isomerase